MKNKILIVTKHPKSKGGVVNYYNHFFNVFQSDDFELQWFTIGSRPGDYDNRLNRKWAYALEFIVDILRFIHYLLKNNRRVKIVQISPSFFEIPLLRDTLYFLIAKLFRKKVIVFFRGWSKAFEKKIYKKSGIFKYVLKILSKSNAVLILAFKFKEVLVHFGFSPNQIHVTRTMFVKTNIVDSNNKSEIKPLKYIFIARVSFQKGIIDIIEALNLLNQKGLEICVDIYGHFANSDIKISADKLVKQYQLENQIHFKGFINGFEKYSKLSNANVFLFPTFHDEGCPNSVIEALASGLFVIATPVGAIDELVVDKENGLIIPTRNPQKLAQAILWTANNKETVLQIAKINKRYAYEQYEQEVMVSQIKKIYNTI